MVQDAETANHGKSGGIEKPEKWDIYVFAWMNKVQLENWVRRQNHGAKLATIGTDQTCTVEITPESKRRSSERLYRRAKKRLRRLCQSSRPCTEDADTPEPAFDDVNAETQCESFTPFHKEASSSSVSVSKEDGNVERCSVQSAHVNHSVSPCTPVENFAQKHIDVNVECDYSVHPKTDDLLCDKEVSIIFEKGLVTEVEGVTGNNDDPNHPETSCSHVHLGKDSSEEEEENDDVSLGDQGNECGRDGVQRGPVAGAESDSIHKEDAVIRSFPTKVFDSSEDKEHQPLDIDMHDIADDVVLHHAVSEGNREAKDRQANPCVTADMKNVNELKSIGDFSLDLNSQHEKDTSDTPQNVKEVTEDVEVNQSTADEAMVVRSGSVIFEDQKPSLAGQSTPDVENNSREEGSLGHETPKCPDEGETGEEKILAEPDLGPDGCGGRGEGEGEGEKRAGIKISDPKTRKENHMNEAPVETLAAEEKTDGSGHERTASTVANALPIEASIGISSDQLNKAHKTPSTTAGAAAAGVLTSCDPGVLKLVPGTVPSALEPLPQTHIPHFPPPPLPLRPSLPRNVACSSVNSCPPGSELLSPTEASGNSTIFPSDSVAQEVANKDEDDEDRRPPKSVMDHSVVSALMQFYTESNNVNGNRNCDLKEKENNAKTNSGVCISTRMESVQKSGRKHEETSDMEIDSDNERSESSDGYSIQIDNTNGSRNSDLKEKEDDAETNSCVCISTSMESAQKGGRKHQETSDMEIDSDQEKSESSDGYSIQINNTNGNRNSDLKEKEDNAKTNSGVCISTRMESVQKSGRKHEETSDMEIDSDQERNATIMVIERSESSNGYSIQDKPAKLDSADTVNQQSLAAGVQLHAEDDKVSVGKSLDVSAAKNPDVDANLLEDQELLNNDSLKEIPGCSGNERQETLSCVSRNDLGVGKIDMEVDVESLLKCSSVTSNKSSGDSPDVIPNNTMVMGDNLVENPKGTSGRSQAENLDFAKDEVRVQEGIIGIKGKTRKNVTDENYQENPIVSVYKPRAEEPANLEEDLSEEQLLSPIDPLFMASAEQTIFSSIGGLRNLLGQSSTFDRIAEETIASTVSSLEDILRQANCSYLELSSCPSDSGVSVGEEASGPSRVFNFNNITHLANPPQEKDCRTGSLDGQSPSGVGQPEWLSTNEKSDARCYLGRGMFVCSN